MVKIGTVLGLLIFGVAAVLILRALFRRMPAEEPEPPRPEEIVTPTIDGGGFFGDMVSPTVPRLVSPQETPPAILPFRDRFQAI